MREGIEAHGMRPFARSLDVPIGVIRSTGADRNMSAAHVQILSVALSLALYIGPPRDLDPPPEVEVNGHRFDTLPRYDAQVAGGRGVLNLDEDPVDRLAFNMAA